MRIDRSSRAWCLAAALAIVSLGAACSSSSDSSSGGSSSGARADDDSRARQVAFPGAEWQRADPAELGFDPVVLDTIAAEAEAAGSNCLLVVRNGRIAGEWYWNGTDESSSQQVFSATKSYASTLVGIAQAEGLLDVEDRAADYIPEWAGTPAESVTIENLLSNDSGRALDPAIDYGELLRATDANALTIGLPQEAPPGATWGYNNAAIQAIDAVLQAATGRNSAQYAEEKLLGVIGMASSEMGLDPAGNTLTYQGLASTCPDMARYGHLFAERGNWDGTEVVPDEWVDAATGQPSQSLNAAYGYLWWLNRPGAVLTATQALTLQPAEAIESGQLVPGAPDDMYFALGLGGQIIAVDPGSGTVVVRLGPVGSELPFGAADAAKVITDALRTR